MYSVISRIWLVVRPQPVRQPRPLIAGYARKFERQKFPQLFPRSREHRATDRRGSPGKRNINERSIGSSKSIRGGN